MAIDLWREKNMESCGRGAIMHRWTASREFALDDIVCNEWTKSVVAHIRPRRVRPLQRLSQTWSAESAHQVVSKLKEELLAIADVLTPALNPSLQSALSSLDETKKLTPSELIALNSVIGRASIQNEFDIEALYAREDEIDG